MDGFVYEKSWIPKMTPYPQSQLIPYDNPPRKIQYYCLNQSTLVIKQ
jgi:hypothetical protein